MREFAKSHLRFLLPAAKAIRSFALHQPSKRKVRNILKQRAEILVEVGAGDVAGKNGWVTIDITDHCDIYWDLRKGIPFPDQSVTKIYSSHFFEHLSFRETQKFLAECRRALAPGGKFLICVPNARIWLEAYVKGTTLDPKAFLGWSPAYNHTTQIDYANYVAYMDGEHKYMFDEENLLFILNLAGFKNVSLRKFDPSLDKPERDQESIYAEAER
jgi:predicted SAM-dependent methyltransferase